MKKDFDRWNEKKKSVEVRHEVVDFASREIWWCVIGMNIGSEQHSQSEDFSRPVLIINRFTPDMFWGVPLTTKVYDAPYRFRFVVDGTENDALLLQMRAFDRKRLVRKICFMKKNEFRDMIRTIHAMIPNATDSAYAESSEAEATV